MKRLLPAGSEPRGFALVVTLSLMILLTLIAVGLLSLASVSLRTTSQGSAQAEARANARLALLLAIGELQKQAGPDTRITAPADILDANNAPLTGVWKSWEGTDHETSGDLAGRPKSPIYDSKTKPEANDGRFLSWLVSGTNTNSAVVPGDAKNLVKKAPFSKSIALVSTGSLATGDDRQVHVKPVSVDNNSGAYAWWISGENQKAHMPKPYEPENDTAAGWSDLARSHAVADPEVFELESLLDDPSPAEKTFTRATADLFAKDGATTLAHQSFHDLSAISVGLLTNVATGGWRKDLSLLTESWDQQPKEDLPLFRLKPGDEPDDVAMFTRPSRTNADFRKERSLFYPWSDYYNRVTGGIDQYYQRQVGAVSSWANLAAYATFYRDSQLTTSPSGQMTIPTRSWSYQGSADILYNNLHEVRIVPKIARIQWIFYHYALDAENVYNDPAFKDKLIPCVLLTPVFTLWNPFNFTIDQAAQLPSKPLARYVFRLDSVMPPALKYEIDGETKEYYSLGDNGSNLNYENNISEHWQTFYVLPAGISLKPGETRVFSPANGTIEPIKPNDKNKKAVINLVNGFRPANGLAYRLDNVLALGNWDTPDGKKQVALNSGASIKVLGSKFDAVDREGPGVGIKGQMGIETNTNVQTGGSYDGHLIFSGKNKQTEAQTLYPEKGTATSTTLGEARTEPVPFMSMIFGDRIASKTHSDDGRATKGLVQASPLVYYTAVADRYGPNDVEDGRYLATRNLINSSWDFSFIYHSSGGDIYSPQVDDTSGYIITGFQPIDGITRCVLAELPARPLASLGDLTHWDFRLNNPVPPFGYNLIGNSDATPLIPSDAVVNSAESAVGARQNRQHDDSYCANHLLFDDWFFSSITPEPTNFGSSGKTQKENFTDFLTGNDPLANRAYRPILEDAVTDLSDANQIYTDHVAPPNSWQTIASRLEVDGMFNVNSTSVKAWRALLRHARNQKIPYSLANGQATLSAETDHAFSRTSIAGDQEAGTKISGVSPEATEFTGYRVFDEDMLDKLAEEVVKQVRLRGPFLSLSEFVNRQLSRDEDLAVAGAVQAALNKLAEDSSLNPFEVLEDVSAPSVADPPGEDEYEFPKAAIGYNTYGLPGWTRQVDILRPLSPILAARDDTFTIRTYGDSRDAAGNVQARAWCEATVRRSRDFVDSAEPADLITAPAEPANQTYGRQFQIISFRWLGPDEV